MAKTADVLKSIWADPWFLALPPDGKLIFLWGITNEHANMAGLYVVAEETIRHETKFTVPRLAKAFKLVHPKMGYRPETGYVVIPGRPNRMRQRTEPIAKSIVEAVRECAHPEIQSHYIEKYGHTQWLGGLFAVLASELGLGEPQRVSVNLGEVPSQSHSQTTKEKDNGRNNRPKPDPTAIPDEADPVLADAAERCHATLVRVAEARQSTKPVLLAAVYRAVETFPKKDHLVVAGEVEHWLVFGRGSGVPAKDVVARFRKFLEGSEDTAPSSTQTPQPSSRSGSPRSTVAADLAKLEAEHAEAKAQEEAEAVA